MQFKQTPFLAAFAALLISQAAAQTPENSAAIDLTGPPANLARLHNYESARVASEDRAGNADMRRIGPGETLTLADITGPGEITHIWTTVNTKDKNHLRNIVFRIYWDGNDYPSVESPVGDFFGLGHGKYYVFDNPVQAIGTDNGMNCFWPMPFRKGARVTATNESQTTVGAYYYYVDYRKFDKLPDDISYFHAQYNQAMPNKDGERYLIAETDGGRGHFAGVSLSVHTQANGWWGEGDDVFTIDGEKTPSLWGTGSEDYFCGAWCYGKTFYNNYFGMPLRERLDQGLDNYWNVYRLHLESPITFKKSIKVEIEHGDNGVSNTRKPRNNDYSSCAYWYVESPQKLKGKLAPAAERIPAFLPMPHPDGALEAQYMKANTPKSVAAETQTIGSAANHTGKWLNGDQLWVTHQKPGQTTTLNFNTTAPMSGDAVMYITRAKDYGKVQYVLDGQNLGTVDAYSPNIDRAAVKLGDLNLKAGDHKLEVTVRGKNDKSSGTYWGIDYLGIGAPDEEPNSVVTELTPEK